MTDSIERKMYDWIDFVVMKSLPNGFIDCPYIRRITKLKPVFRKTLRQNILSLVKVMKEKI